jgi:DNA-binding IclR family transcriptional regulator
MSELEEIRERGFATSVGETVPGAAALAAPIMDSTGRAIAALNITGPADRLDADAIAAAVPLLREAVSRVVQHLGYDGAG